jgi:hypothetical protein
MKEYDVRCGKRSAGTLITSYDVVEFSKKIKTLCRCSYCGTSDIACSRIFFYCRKKGSKLRVADGVFLCIGDHLRSQEDMSYCQKSLAPLHLPAPMVGQVIETVVNAAATILQKYQTEEKVKDFIKKFGIWAEPVYGNAHFLVTKKWIDKRFKSNQLTSPYINKIYRFGTMQAFCMKWGIKQSERSMEYVFYRFPEISIYLPDLDGWYEEIKNVVHEAAMEHYSKLVMPLNCQRTGSCVPYLAPHLLNRIYTFAFTPILPRFKHVIKEDKLLRYKSTVWFIEPLKRKQAIMQLCHTLYNEIKLFPHPQRCDAKLEFKIREIELTLKNALKKGRIKKIIKTME